MRDLQVASPFSKMRCIVNLEILYIISFKPTTIYDFITNLGISFDIFVLVVVVLRSGVVLF